MTTRQAPIAATGQGQVEGVMIEGIAAFLGIPYGAPTSGANRFRAPLPPAPWSGLRDATRKGGRAPQAGLRPGNRPELETLSGPPDTSPDTEDCLTLHVWTPSVTDGGKRPVMVWLHGGAFAYGSANSERTRGSRLAKRGDVVVVTVNHRLNIFGHLDLSAIGGAEFADSGNAGVLDMVAALRWVRDNVAGFGGDPNNVTIFGESGGGGKVSVLLAMPQAQGLFHRAIIQSGAALRLRSRQRALDLTDRVLATLGIRDIAALQALPVAALLNAVGPAQKALGAADHPLFDRYPFGPVVDGTLLPHQPFDPAAPDCSTGVPLLIGDMAEETTIFLAPDDKVWNRTLTEAELEHRVAVLAGDHAGRVLDTYRGLFPDGSPAERLIAITTDCNFRVRSWTLAQRRAALAARTGGAPVWMYSFEWKTPVHGGKLAAPHAMDVPFTFDTIDLTNLTDMGAAARGLAETMSGVWAAFARSGRPEHPAIPDWPPYDAAQRRTLMLDAPCHVSADPSAERRRLWQEITGTSS